MKKTVLKIIKSATYRNIAFFFWTMAGIVRFFGYGWMFYKYGFGNGFDSPEDKASEFISISFILLAIWHYFFFVDRLFYNLSLMIAAIVKDPTEKESNKVNP